MAAKRDFSEPFALNWATDGTDVDLGSLARQLVGFCVRGGVIALFGHEVRNLTRNRDGGWTLHIGNRRTGETCKQDCEVRVRRRQGRCVATAAEVRHQGGPRVRRLPDRRPVPARRQPGADRRTPGQGVRCPRTRRPAAGGLHLDLRFVNGKSWLVFGPYAGWSPKFLKHGHASDLTQSVRPDNVVSILGVGMTETRLLAYLIRQLRLTGADRMRTLREFAPSAANSD